MMDLPPALPIPLWRARHGKSEHYIKIRINKPIKEGEIIKCKIQEINGDELGAHLI